MKGEEQSVSPSFVAAPRPRFLEYDLIDITCIAVTAAIAVAAATNERNAIRSVAAVAFLLFVPGRAIVTNWPAVAARSQVAVSVLFSLTALTLAATLTLWANFWHPIGLLEVECVITAAALLAGILRRRRASAGLEEITVDTGASNDDA